VDLTLLDAGGRTQALSYQVPDVNQCAQCHEPGHKAYGR